MNPDAIRPISRKSGAQMGRRRPATHAPQPCLEILGKLVAFCRKFVYDGDQMTGLGRKSGMVLRDRISAYEGRFSSLLQGTSGARLPYDQPLLDRPDWVVAPTLGAIVPNWLIAVPREPALSFRAWRDEYDKLPKCIHNDLIQHLGITSTDLVWFEHGPLESGSPVGCGTDYAHIHFIIRPTLTFEEFAQQAIYLSRLTWSDTTLDNAYDTIPRGESYLVIGSGDEAIFTSKVEKTGSQFFRRVVNSLSDQPDGWDYKRFPHLDNIADTIANFRALESDVRRGK